MITDIITYRKASPEERSVFIESFLKDFLSTKLNYTIASTYRGPDELILLHNIDLPVNNGVIDSNITSKLLIKEGILKLKDFRPQLNTEISHITKKMNALWIDLLERYDLTDRFGKICLYGDNITILGMFEHKKRVKIYNSLSSSYKKDKNYIPTISFEIEFDYGNHLELEFTIKGKYQKKDSLKPTYKTYRLKSFEEVECVIEKLFYLTFFKEEYDLGRFTSKRLDLVKMFTV